MKCPHRSQLQIGGKSDGQLKTVMGMTGNDHFQPNQEGVTDASLTGFILILGFATDKA